jgi:hypothetical protein
LTSPEPRAPLSRLAKALIVLWMLAVTAAFVLVNLPASGYVASRLPAPVWKARAQLLAWLAAPAAVEMGERKAE